MGEKNHPLLTIVLLSGLGCLFGLSSWTLPYAAIFWPLAWLLVYLLLKSPLLAWQKLGEDPPQRLQRDDKKSRVGWIGVGLFCFTKKAVEDLWISRFLLEEASYALFFGQQLANLFFAALWASLFMFFCLCLLGQKKLRYFLPFVLLSTELSYFWISSRLFPQYFIPSSWLEQPIWQSVFRIVIEALGADGAGFALNFALISWVVFVGSFAKKFFALVLVVGACWGSSWWFPTAFRQAEQKQLFLSLLPSRPEPPFFSFPPDHLEKDQLEKGRVEKGRLEKDQTAKGRTKKDQAKPQHLKDRLNPIFILPESAYDGVLEYSERFDRLISEEIPEGGFMILGTDKKEPKENGFRLYNSVYLLTARSYQLQVVKKKYLVPGGESLPLSFKALGLGMFQARQAIYSEGKAQAVEFAGAKWAIGICFEALLPIWYSEQAAFAPEIYLILSREYLFPPWMQQKIDRITIWRMLGTGRPWLKVSAGGQDWVQSAGRPLEQAKKEEFYFFY